MTHWLQKQVYPYILDNEEEEISQNIFERGTIAYFPDGAEAHTTWISFSKEKYITCYTVNIEMFEHRWITPLNVAQSGEMIRFLILIV